MPARAPKFWSRRNHPLGKMLAPLGWLYGLGVRGRFALTKPFRSGLPVICVGNFTMGGGGKTPLALEMARLLTEQGYRPVFLTRGYGGGIDGPHLVDVKADNAQMVGDEALLLARVAPVVVCADRPAGARFIERMQSDVIVMDDGFQNPTLCKDLNIVVVDEIQGVGNGGVFPAGPLRASLHFQLARTDVLVIAGPSATPGTRISGDIPDIKERFEGPVFRSDLRVLGKAGELEGRRVMAVTGIARPDKFFASLQEVGAIVVQMHDFPDHHFFSEQEADNLLSLSKTDEAAIIMTRKDWVRLPANGQRGRLRERALVLDVAAGLDRPEDFLSLLQRSIISPVSDRAVQ